MWSRSFWKGLGERALKTFLGTFVAASSLGEPGASVFNIDWQGATGVALTATLVSAVMSLLSAPAGPEGSPSLVNDRPGDR